MASLLNQTINKALAKSVKDNHIRYISVTYYKIVTSFEKPPFDGCYYKTTADGKVFEYRGLGERELHPLAKTV